MKKFYLRDDDAAAADARFLKTFRLLKAEGLPASYAVVPAALDKGLVRFLKNERRAGAVFEVLQHGWSHKNRGSRWLKQEFGHLTPPAVQEREISKGFTLLKKNFGGLFTPVFVPPFHMYNIDTVRAALSCGLKGLSASKRLPGMEKIFFKQANIDVNRYSLSGRPLPLDLACLKQKTLDRLRSGREACAYFHHATFDEPNFRVFAAYLAFLRKLRDLGAVEFSLFKNTGKERTGGSSARKARAGRPK